MALATAPHRHDMAMKPGQQEHIRRLEFIVANTTNMVVVTNGRREIEWVNPAYTRVTGWTLGEVKGKNPATFLHGPETSADDAAKLSTLLNQGQAANDFELLNYKKSGEPYWVSLNIQPVVGAAGRVEQYVSIQSDITARKQHEQAVRDKELLERTLQTQTEVMSRVSHELRTPLHAILGFSELLDRNASTLLEDRPQAYLAHIRNSAQHLLKLVNDILGLTRLTSEQMSYEIAPVDAHRLVVEVASMLEPLASGRGVQINVGPPGPASHVLADPQRLRQVLINLIGNAIKYNRPHGRVDVRITLIDKSDVAIAVSDTGQGIEQGAIAGLFEPFARSSAEAQSVEGSGLGLAIARTLARGMNGDVVAASAVGVGSTFVVCLPAAAGFALASLQAGAEQSPREPVPGRAEGAAQGVAGKVLYIEDNEINRILVEAYVEARPGVDLSCSATGIDGVAAARRIAPDLILVDLQLPDISGFEVINQIRGDPALRHTACVAFSANAQVSEIEAAISAGFRDYLVKPASQAEFLVMLDRFLDAAARRRRAEPPQPTAA
jgi:PAS domain S-box-containing protein